MFLLKRILIIFFLSLPISHSFASMVSLVQSKSGLDDGGGSTPNALDFNDDGTKLFIVYQQSGDTFSYVNEYTLSSPFNVSTASYAGDSERCYLDNTGGDTDFGPEDRVFGIDFSKDGMKLFVARGNTGGDDNDDKVFRFDLTSPFDVSTCSFANETTDLDTEALQEDSNAGDPKSAGDGSSHENNRAQGIEINDDGTKLFVTYHGQGGNFSARLLEYELSTPYDLGTISLVTTAGINLDNSVQDNPMGLDFSKDGKRLFIVSHNNNQRSVTQISLTKAYDTSSFTIDGSLKLTGISGVPSEVGNFGPRGLAFSFNGLKMYVMHDAASEAYEFDLVCPFNLFAGKCSPITENKDRTGIATAQIEIAKRTIDHSTDTALNRLKWIRRNKDKQNLTNLNIDFNFTNQKLASLTEVVKASAAKKKIKNKDEAVFYWSEGSIVVGRVGDTSISSTKKIGTDALTFGADKFTDNNGIKGLAFRVGRNNVDIGNAGSNLDTDTFNITYYATTPLKEDNKFLDTIIGFGKLNLDLLTVIDGKNFTADRSGHQIYGTIRIKDELKKDNLIIIPSGRFDIGHTLLGSYKEAEVGGIDVKEQHVRTKKIRAGISAVEDVSNDKHVIKRHGKLEYVMDIDRSSEIEYTYVEDGSVIYNDTLHSDALHNINGEIGIDIVMPNSFSIFLIYERNQALGSGHTDKIHVAIGYLPNKENNYVLSIDGSEGLVSKFKIKKNIDDFNIDLNFHEDFSNFGNNRGVAINLNKLF